MTKWRRWIWIAATLFALVNMLATVRRLPILQMQQRTPEEAAAEAAADWLGALPADTHVALLISHRDITSIWFHYRIGYFLYPQRHELFWEAVPQDYARRFDFVLAFASAQDQSPPGWNALAHVGMATLFGRPGVRIGAGRTSAPAPLLQIVFGLLALATAPVLGLLVLGWSTPRSPFDHWAASLALAHIAGTAVLTCTVTAATLAAGHIIAWPVYALVLVLVPGAPRAWRWLAATSRPRTQSEPFELTSSVRSSREPTESDSSTSEKHPEGRREDPQVPAIADGAGYWQKKMWVRALTAMVLLGVLCAVARGAMLGLDWDGYSIWQLKAKAFFLDESFHILRDTVHFPYAHLDYPLLVPVQTWWVYIHLGAVSDRWAQASGYLFYVDLLAVFWAAARRYVERLPACMGLAVLACLPEATQHAASGFADMPLAVEVLLTGALLTEFLVSRDNSAARTLPWILASAALTKNEGLLLAATALTVQVGYWIFARRVCSRTVPRSVAVGATAVAAAYGPWFIAKRLWGLKNDLLEERAQIVQTEPLWWRLGTTISGYVAQLAHVGPMLPAWGLLIVLFPFGVSASWQRRVTVTVPLWALAAAQLAGYTAIYLVTPLPLKAHMGSSVDRLMLHLIPTMLLASLLGCYAPERDPTIERSDP